MRPQDGLGVDELGVGLEATLRDVNAFVLFFLRDPDTHDSLDSEEHDKAGDEHPSEDGGSADELAREAGVVAVGDRNQQQTQQTHNTVHRDGTDGIVDLHLVQRDDGEDHENATDRTEDHGLQGRRRVRASSDRYEARQCTVKSP